MIFLCVRGYGCGLQIFDIGTHNQLVGNLVKKWNVGGVVLWWEGHSGSSRQGPTEGSVPGQRLKSGPHNPPWLLEWDVNVSFMSHWKKATAFDFTNLRASTVIQVIPWGILFLSILIIKASNRSMHHDRVIETPIRDRTSPVLSHWYTCGKKKSCETL